MVILSVMATTIKYQDKEIHLYSEYLGVAYPWGEKYKKKHHLVTVRVDRHEAKFDFYCNDRVLSAKDLKGAFYFFLSDGISFYNAGSIDEFAAEFGYDKPSQLLDAYEGCKDAWFKWKPFGINAWNLANWLQEKYDL